MRIAIFSDVHSNLEALETAFADMDARRVDRRVCLGDIVGYGANPRECLDLVRARADLVVLGNHDAATFTPSLVRLFSDHAQSGMRWTLASLTPTQVEYLRSLPFAASQDGNRYVHASPGRPEEWTYLTNGFFARHHAREFGERLCFIGHVHRPQIFAMKPGVASGPDDAYNTVDRFIINAGSVGQPRDRDPRLCYGVLDTVAGSWEIVRLAYDVEKAMRKIIDAGLDRHLATRLARGV